MMEILMKLISQEEYIKKFVILRLIKIFLLSKKDHLNAD